MKPRRLDSPMYLKSQVLLSQAKRLADATDRVFVSLAEGVGKIGPWSERRSSPPPRIAALKPQDAARRNSPLLETKDKARVGTRRADPELHAEVAVRDCVLEPAGVVPVLEALGRVMESHANSRYAAAAEDDRFWGLIRLLQSLVDGDPGLELTSASPMGGEIGCDIHVEEDLSQLRAEDLSRGSRVHETNQRERAG